MAGAAHSVRQCLSSMHRQLQCSICLELFRDPVLARCGHSFCRHCISRALALVAAPSEPCCPLCKAALPRRAARARGSRGGSKVHALLQGLQALTQAASQDAGQDILQAAPAEEGFPETAPSVPERSINVESWLKEVTPSSISQESNYPPESIATQSVVESDLEFDSVSQVKPKSTLTWNKIKSTKPACTFIEVGGSESCSNVSKKMVSKRKTPVTEIKSSLSKKNSMKPIHYVKDSVSSGKGGVCSVNISPNAAVQVVEGEKENTSKLAIPSSPGWSCIKQTRKGFTESHKLILKAKNVSDAVSPPPSGEAGNGVEEPCISLSISSPSRRTKETIDMIVSGLEADIDLCEKASFLEEKDPVISNSSKPSSDIIGGCKLSAQQIKEADMKNQDKVHPVVKFVKLGSFTSCQSYKIPFILKGTLLHLPVKDHLTDYLSRPLELSSVETQWSPQPLPNGTLGDDLQDNQQFLTDSTIKVMSGKFENQRKSYDAPSEVNTVFMDAETVIISQLPPQNHPETETSLQTDHSHSISIGCSLEPNLPVIQQFKTDTLPKITIDDFENVRKSNGASCEVGSDLMDVETVLVSQQPTPVHPEGGTHSQATNVSIFSADEEENIVKEPVVVIQPDSDDGSSSSSSCDLKKEKSHKKVRPLSRYSDSSDSDVNIVMSDVNSRKKVNNHDKSEDVDEDSPDLNISLPMCTADIEATINANIEASLKNAECPHSSDWYNPRPNIPNDVLQEHTNNTPQLLEVGSDNDSDVLSATPVTGMCSRDVSQSDDIVPDSQPVEVFKGKIEQKLNASASASNSNSLHSEHKSPKSANEAKLCFICSNLPASSAAEVQKLADLVGAEFSSSFSSDTTHLIVRTDDQNAADKTLKYLCAVAAGRWVVSFQWVLDSLTAGKLMPEEQYEAIDSSGEPGPRRSRLAHKDGTLLFKGFEIYCHGDFPGLPKSQMEYILSKCGAAIIEDTAKFSFSDGVFPISLCNFEDGRDEEYLPWLNKHGSLLLQHDWVYDCIGQFRLLSLYSYIVCDAPEDLSVLGFPPNLVEPSDSDQ